MRNPAQIVFAARNPLNSLDPAVIQYGCATNSGVVGEDNESLTGLEPRFNPQTLTVATGTTVTWTTTDNVAHTVTWDDRSVDSGLLIPNETFTFTFNGAGTYGYFCIPHGSPGAGMFGSVIVTDG